MRDFNKHQIKRADLVFRGRMAKTGFLNHPSFQYSFASEGFSNFTFGAVTGPAMALSNIFHEMAHAVDFVISGDDLKQRTLGGRYHFNVNKISINEQEYEQVATTQCTERECRTFAIQLRLMHIVGFKTKLDFFANDAAKLTTWLPDWFLVEGNNEGERINWCRNRIIDLYHGLNDEVVLNAFQKWLDDIAVIKIDLAA